MFWLPLIYPCLKNAAAAEVLFIQSELPTFSTESLGLVPLLPSALRGSHAGPGWRFLLKATWSRSSTGCGVSGQVQRFLPRDTPVVCFLTGLIVAQGSLIKHRELLHGICGQSLREEEHHRSEHHCRVELQRSQPQIRCPVLDFVNTELLIWMTDHKIQDQEPDLRSVEQYWGTLHSKEEGYN